MSHGYSVRVADLNRKADKRHLGVRLGRVCIKRDIPVSLVAAKIGVSRQTIYNWFCGFSTPNAAVSDHITKFLATLGN